MIDALWIIIAICAVFELFSWAWEKLSDRIPALKRWAYDGDDEEE